jgi:hypothetical protein
MSSEFQTEPPPEEKRAERGAVLIVTVSPVPSLLGRAQINEFLTLRRKLRFILAVIAAIVIAAVFIAAILGISTDAAHPRGQRTSPSVRVPGRFRRHWGVRSDYSGEFAEANPVREKPGPPSNRMGDFRFTTKRAETAALTISQGVPQFEISLRSSRLFFAYLAVKALGNSKHL